MPHLFIFSTTWHLPHSIDKVWQAIADAEKYPTWWSGISEAKVTATEQDHMALGTKVNYKVSSPLYTLKYQTEVIDFKAGEHIIARSTGDLAGTGKWTFKATPSGTDATFDWQVTLTPPFLEFASHIPGVKSIMHFFHDRLMDQGEAGLKKFLQEK